MHSQHLDKFVRAAGDVLVQMGVDTTRTGEPGPPEDIFAKYELVVVVGLARDMRGSVVYSMAADTAMALAGAMMGGMTISELDEMVKSAVCEFANMAAGSSVTVLGNHFQVEITPPTLVYGKKMAIMMGGNNALVTGLSTPWGELEISLCLNDQ